MVDVIEFEGFKFKTSIDFKSVKSKDHYFDNILIESLCKYQVALKSYFTEKLHIVFSYATLFKFVSWFVLAIGLLTTLISLPAMFNITILGISVLCFLVSVLFNMKFKSDAEKYSFIISVSEMEDIMEEVRQDLIKNK